MNKIEQKIDETKNAKHRLVLNLLYKLRLSTGMVINIKIKDIRKNILYCRGRRMYIPDSLMHDVYEFSHARDPDEYLLKSNRDKKYSIRSVQKIRDSFLKKLSEV